MQIKCARGPRPDELLRDPALLRFRQTRRREVGHHQRALEVHRDRIEAEEVRPRAFPDRRVLRLAGRRQRLLNRLENACMQKTALSFFREGFLLMFVPSLSWQTIFSKNI